MSDVDGIAPSRTSNARRGDRGGIYIAKALKAIEGEMEKAALRMDDALFVEYWGESVPPEKRIARWLEKADRLATGWIPSQTLFRR